MNLRAFPTAPRRALTILIVCCTPLLFLVHFVAAGVSQCCELAPGYPGEIQDLWNGYAPGRKPVRV